MRLKELHVLIEEEHKLIPIYAPPMPSNCGLWVTTDADIPSNEIWFKNGEVIQKVRVVLDNSKRHCRECGEELVNKGPKATLCSEVVCRRAYEAKKKRDQRRRSKDNRGKKGSEKK